MSLLTVYSEHQPQQGERFTDIKVIKEQLHDIGVQFDRWPIHEALGHDVDQETVLKAYAEDINCLKEQYGFQSFDVIHVTPDHPDKVTLRQKFLAEHVHDDFEVRFFIEGCGLFYLHVADKVYVVLCEQGDLISVPANTPHWFDMGANPHFKTIRLFTTQYGWVANFTGNQIAGAFPTLDEMLAEDEALAESA
ncbi:MAG: cupin [Methylovulum sp.]|nr:cupin [Methylovulum sp.]